VRKHLRRDREEHLESICEEMEIAQRTNKTKDLFQHMNRLTKQACPSVKLAQSASGDILTEDPEIMERWRDYCEQLYSTTDTRDNQSVTNDGYGEPIPTLEEVEKALKSLKPGKAADPDEIPAELLKLGEESVTVALHRIIVITWRTGKWPTDWTLSTFVPIYKNGDPTVCANYRTISPISHASKVMLKVILSRMRDKVEYEVAEEQAGFWPGRGTHNHLCNLRLITERARARRQLLYLCFIDFQKAFDTVSHKKLWNELRAMGYSPHLVALIRSLYEDQKSNVCLANSRSEYFQVLRGVRQGCSLSPYLFNIMPEVLMHLALEGFEGGFRIGGRLLTNLRYADDIVLLASTNGEL